MPRGGYREGSGHKPGSKYVRTLTLGKAVEATGKGDILSALAEVAEDKLSNVDVRLDACQALFRLFGRAGVFKRPSKKAHYRKINVAQEHP